MNVLIVSQCTKNALIETRRILDQFAERRGERTWQTPITQAGLDTLYKLLRKTARKNTAVACHWIRGKDHSELMWIVGDAQQFNERGATPTNTTKRDILRKNDENDWHSAEDISLIAQVAALFHDLGKASTTFQKKLLSTKNLADPLRHEWVSLRLFEAFIGSKCTCDQEWLSKLSQLDATADISWLEENLHKDGSGQQAYSPFKTLGTKLPLARAIGWLIVSHHRLPVPDQNRALQAQELAQLPAAISHSWCGSQTAPSPAENSRTTKKADANRLHDCWTFPLGLPFKSTHWCTHAARVASALLQRSSKYNGTDLEEKTTSPYLLHLARMALMLADHHYSSEPSHARYGDPVKKGQKTLYANTRWVEWEKSKALNQRLDEHLIGVRVNVSRLIRSLPKLTESLPRIARHKGFRERAKGDFAWQNKAFDLAENLQETASTHGFFGVNLASTGRGKTLANARIIYGLASQRKGARFTVALGLRTLTLQTGEAYRERLGLGTEDLAIVAGGAATRALHQYHRLQEQAAIDTGSESLESLLTNHNHIRYEGSLEEGPLKHWLKSSHSGKASPSALLDAPVLVCTIDHLMPATESTRGGHQILPMLRIMTSDLILDEPDDFDIADLPALTRLVHWFGLLGSRVLLSSATLPPALVQGLFLAYRAGRKEFQRHQGEPGTALAICCAWFDEFNCTTSQYGSSEDGSDFLAHHNKFINHRIERLTAQQRDGVRRRAAIRTVSVNPGRSSDRASIQRHVCQELAFQLKEAAFELHSNHYVTDPGTQKRVSFGLIRLANIDPLFEIAQALLQTESPDGVHIHLCAYHSRHPMVLRAGIEHILDNVLKRNKPNTEFQQTHIRNALDKFPTKDHLFIVLATAVAEVGRDHDYDWAIVEPSSMRSIIQLAGRVKRHRNYNCPPKTPNIMLLDRNVKSLKGGSAGKIFRWPGFENEQFPLNHQRLDQLLTPEQWQIIDARARIRPREHIDPLNNLADLEHARLTDLMLGAQPGESQKENPVHWWWTTQAHLTGLLQTRSRFRADPQGHLSYFFLVNEENGELDFRQWTQTGQEVAVGNLLHEVSDEELFTGTGISTWAVPDYFKALSSVATAQGIDLSTCARKFGVVDLPDEETWRHHPALGFARKL